MKKHLLLGIALAMVLIGAVVAVIYLSNRPLPSEEEADAMAAIQAEIDAGNYESARTQLEEVLAEDEGDAEAHFKLGLVYFNLGEYQLAQERFSRSLELEPDRAAAVHHNLGVLAYQTGDMDGALEEFRAALSVDPDDPDTHYQLGATYLLVAFPTGAEEPDMESLASAEAEFERALEVASGKPEALVGLANVYMLRGEMTGAIDLLEQAIEQAPEMREALFALGRAYAAVGERDRAIDTLETFLATDPPAMWAQQAQELLDELDQ
ncbi:MAG: tetratricopeptide repeat protein [Anaerolineae bacterium]